MKTKITKNSIKESVDKVVDNFLNELKRETYLNARDKAIAQGRTTMANRFSEFLDKDKGRIDRNQRRRRVQHFLNFNFCQSELGDEIITVLSCMLNVYLYDHRSNLSQFVLNSSDIPNFNEFEGSDGCASRGRCVHLIKIRERNVLPDNDELEDINEHGPNQINRTSTEDIRNQSIPDPLIYSTYIIPCVSNIHHSFPYIFYTKSKNPTIYDIQKEGCRNLFLLCEEEEIFMKKIFLEFFAIEEIETKIRNVIKNWDDKIASTEMLRKYF